MKRSLLSLLTLSLLTFNGMAQHNHNHDVVPCGTDEALEALHAQFPELKAEYEAAQLLRNSAVVSYTSNGKKKATNYIIPVVFHILHEYGSENVSDANIYALMEELNEDYSATNADINQVVTMFDTIAADAGVQFRLAAIDPYGNCTNGIEHIYSHETNNGDSFSKLNQWDRSNYLNVWVVKEPNSGGTVQGTLLGYATLPASTDGSSFWTDGIVLRDYTAQPGNRTLTHEAGHYFGLRHPFNGVEDIGDPSECGDDGIADTPPTEGSFSTCNLNLPTCDTSVAELPLANVQNYMDYSNCSVMFTRDQASFMSNTLQGIAGQRNVLSDTNTLMATGVFDLQMPQNPTNELTVPLCEPVADFFADQLLVCTGTDVNFEDVSWNAVVDSRTWDFGDGATPATSTNGTETVSWSTPGWKTITLTVTNAAGSNTRTSTEYIYVSPDWYENAGPTLFDMESTDNWGNGTNYFLVQNPEDNHGHFSVVGGAGYDQSTAFKLNNYLDNSNAQPYTDDYFYNFRLGGSVDNLITPTVDLRYTTNVTVTFKYAYATNATSTADITEALRVYSTKNCGETWNSRIVTVEGGAPSNVITGADLVTAGYASYSDFTPTSNAQWREASFTYNTNSQDARTRFKFEFTASDLASNLYIDNINVTGTLNVTDASILDLELVVFPNPTTGEAINVSYVANDEPTEFILRDAQGKIVAQEVINTTNTNVTKALDNTSELSAGYYLLEVKAGDYSTTKKVVVM